MAEESKDAPAAAGAADKQPATQADAKAGGGDAKPSGAKVAAKTAAKPAAKPAAKAGAKPAAKKKAKEPEKPFEQAINEDVIPATIGLFKERGVSDLSLTLKGTTLSGAFEGGKREFDIYFSAPKLTASKSITYANDGIPASTVESFMIDERKVPAELLVFYIMQRMYAQQWL